MPGFPAARVTDQHVCPMVDPGPKPHVGGPINPPCSPNVQTCLQPQARVTDQATCATPPPDFIVTGSSTVLVNNLMAARMTDKHMHAQGPIITGAPTVEIGGTTAGATLGNPTAGQAICQAMPAGRAPAAGTTFPPGHPQAGTQIPAGTAGQSYNNCGVEVSRQIITRATGTNPGQEGLLNQALANGQANQVPGNMYGSGATLPAQRVAILQANGVPASQVPPTMGNMAQAVAERRGVSVDIWAGNLWPASAGIPPGAGGHNILVTGMQYDANGNLQNVIINDTGMGTCSQSVPAATLQGALIGGANNHVVTNNPIW